MANQTDIIVGVDSWTGPFLSYYRASTDQPSDNQTLEEFPKFNQTTFNKKLIQFLFSPVGGKFRQRFKFESDPDCGEEAPDILLSDFSFSHKIFSKVNRILFSFQITKTWRTGKASWKQS